VLAAFISANPQPLHYPARSSARFLRRFLFGWPMKLLIFGAKWCPVCRVLNESGILDRFIKAHPEVKMVKITLEDNAGNIIDKEGDKAFRQLNLKALPALVFLNGGRAASRHEGGITAAGLERLYKRAA